MNVPSDVIRGRRQALARRWSVAFYNHPSRPDGIIYPSRLNGETNAAEYDRAIGKLEILNATPLIRAAGLVRILGDLKVALG
jgi:hypothetical protein